MEILTSFFSSGTGLTIVAIIIVLAVIGGIALLLRIVRRKHKKSLAFYLILFAVFTMLFFLSALLIDKHVLLYSVIDGAIHGVVVTLLWWICAPRSAYWHNQCPWSVLCLCFFRHRSERSDPLLQNLRFDTGWRG